VLGLGLEQPDTPGGRAGGKLKLSIRGYPIVARK
jgi:hypothetical protein